MEQPAAGIARAVEVLEQFEFAAWKRTREIVREPLAAFTAISELLADKYDLGPQDRIDPQTGEIIRGLRPPELRAKA